MNDNIFRNAERRVESHSFTKKDYRRIDTMSDATLGNQALKKIALRENAVMEELEEAKREKHLENQRRAQAVVEASLGDTKKTLSVNHWFKDMKVKLFKDVVFELFYNAIPLDSDFLARVENSIRKTTDEYIDMNGGFSLLESAIEKSDSTFLKRVKEACESTAKEACNNRLKDKESTLDFELTEDEFEYFNHKKSNLDMDRISQLVKDKVLTVIKDEKERESEEAELIDDIESELSEDESVTDEKTVDEAFQRIVLNKTPIEEGTLFNAIMRTSYEELLVENMAIISAHETNEDKDDEFNLSYDVNYTEDELHGDDCNCDDCDPEVASIDNDDSINDNLHLEESSLNMDKVFAEAISRYTLMETLYTIKLENYKYHDIRKLTEAMLNKKK